MLKRIIVIFVILCSLHFYDIRYLSEKMIEILEIAGIGVCALLFIIHLVYDKQAWIKLHFNVEIIMIAIAVFLSMFIAFSAHGQNFTATLIVQRFMYFYLFYYMLHTLRMEKLEIMRIIFYFGFAFFALYILQYLAYPFKFIHTRMEFDRGTLRIWLVGNGYLTFAYFLCLAQFYYTQKLKYVLFCFLFIIVFILSGTRQNLAVILLLTSMSILFSHQLKSKVLIFFLIFIGLIPAVYVFRHIITEMFIISQQQTSKAGDDVRLRAAIFFLTDFIPNNWAYFLGNGIGSLNTIYGQKIQMYKELFGFYQSDVGIIGDYTKFGVLLILAELVIIIKVMAKKIDENLWFIKFIFVSIILTFLTQSGIFTSGSGIVSVSLLLYLIDLDIFERNSQANLLQEQSV